MIRLKYILPASVIAALHLFGASVAVGQTSSSNSVEPGQAVHDALRAKPQRKSRLPLAPASVFEHAGPAVAPIGMPAASTFSSDGVHVFHDQAPAAVVPRAFGTIKIPYTTKRVAVSILGASTVAAQVPVTSYPYRATGKMVVTDGADDFDCTAALIRRGLLLTAAHCIQNYGQGAAGKADAVQWIPAEFPLRRVVLTASGPPPTGPRFRPTSMARIPATSTVTAWSATTTSRSSS